MIQHWSDRRGRCAACKSITRASEGWACRCEVCTVARCGDLVSPAEAEERGLPESYCRHHAEKINSLMGGDPSLGEPGICYSEALDRLDEQPHLPRRCGFTGVLCRDEECGEACAIGVQLDAQEAKRGARVS